MKEFCLGLVVVVVWGQGGRLICSSVNNPWLGLGPERWRGWSPPGTLGRCYSASRPSARAHLIPEAGGRTQGQGRGPEELLCSLQIRSDTSQILEEDIPLLKAKVTEVRGIYSKVDQLEVCPGK